MQRQEIAEDDDLAALGALCERAAMMFGDGISP